MAQIRLIATDLDGALLRNDDTISPRTRTAIGAAQAAGIAVVFVSARPPRSVVWIAEHLDITGLAVCSNGAILYDLTRHEMLSRRSLPGDLAHDLVSALRAAHPDICFATEQGDRMGFEPAFPQNPAHLQIHPPRIDHAGALCAEELVKLIAYHPELPIEALIKSARACIGDRAEVSFSGDIFIEIAAPGISKAAGLAELCARLELRADEVIAFGDMPNDLPMLAFAGRGVAVANAHPEVVAAADEVAASNQDDGVARVIERLLGGASQQLSADPTP